MSTPLLTLFTAPKAFTDAHTALIQRNALANWAALGAQVQLVLIGNDAGIAEAAAEFGCLHLPAVRLNARGTPLISSIFELARTANDSALLAYVNADILFLPEFVPLCQSLLDRGREFLLVGQRYDLDVSEELSFSGDWAELLRARAHREGRLHSRTGSDYFVFPRSIFTEIPDFSVGRAGWDNWMIYRARQMGWLCVDGTGALDIIHQNHDYRHLPGGKAHYRLPETGENIRLAGGRRALFQLDDADVCFENGFLRPMPLTWQGFWRAVVLYPLLHGGHYGLTQALFTLFHPRRAYFERQRQRELDAEWAKQKGQER